jgi:hypothetical protein
LRLQSCGLCAPTKQLHSRAVRRSAILVRFDVLKFRARATFAWTPSMQGIDPAVISHFLVAIPVLLINRKSASLPFCVQNSFFREREEPSFFRISLLSSLYRLQSSSRCLGVCSALYSLKHLPSLSSPITLVKDLK